MPTREELDVQLLKFLRESESRERRQEEGALKAIGNVAAQVQVLSTKIDANTEVWNERFKGLAARVDGLEKDAEDTGVHNLERLKEERAAALKELGETKGEFRKYIAAAVIALVSGGGIVEVLHRLGGH
ncbi:MAG TPA: hypothetical protein VGH28_10625 [Polyangiaceae bacterium]|jgi:flagellar motility protein MotE (MotC chaperone)